MTDSTTVNLFKLAGAVLDTRPGAIVTDSENFPTDRYVLEGLARRHGRELRIFDADPLNGPQPEDVTRACEAGEVALVSLSHVAYRSGALADMEDRPGRGAGDGDLGPLALRGRGSDRAGAARGGAGGWLHLQVPERRSGRPAFLYVRTELQDRLRTPIQGWFGQRDQFLMERPYDPAPGVRGFLAGTPPILALAGVEEGAKLIAEAGSSTCATRQRLTELIVRSTTSVSRRSASGWDPTRPGPARRHVSLSHDEAWPICRALIERRQVSRISADRTRSASVCRRCTPASRMSTTRSTAW